jgi:hypothetical protein
LVRGSFKKLGKEKGGSDLEQYFIGVDLGQMRDPSTIAVVQRAELRGPWDGAYFAYRKIPELRLRGLERIPLGTPYPEVVERVVEVTSMPVLRGRAHLIVDGTGVGRPVVDLLKKARPAARLKPVWVISGDRQSYSDGYYHVPKRDLIVGLQVLFQNRDLRIAKNLPHGETLVEELANVEVKVTPSGREEMAAWRHGLHDDLVFAVALACWGAKEAHPSAEEYWINRHEAEMAEVFRKYEGWKKRGA